jgi:hypothetical protein
MGVGGQRHAPSVLPPGKRPGTHCMGGRVGPRAGLDGCGKSRLPPGFDPRTTQPVASRHVSVTHCIFVVVYFTILSVFKACSIEW